MFRPVHRACNLVREADQITNKESDNNIIASQVVYCDKMGKGLGQRDPGWMVCRHQGSEWAEVGEKRQAQRRQV